MFKYYFTLTKPRITIFILISTYLGYYLSLRHSGSYMTEIGEWVIFFHLLIGTLLSSAGASSLNQSLEYKSDSKMDRTLNRPIPRGYISPLKGFLFGLTLSMLGIIYLLLNVNPIVSSISFFTIFLYICVYTPFKKISSINTLLGSIPGALPPVGGWFAASNEFTLTTVSIFAIMFCWQIPHFLSLAYIYSDDYRKGGFIMLPSLYSDQVRTRAHIIFFTLLLIAITFTLYFSSMVGFSYLPLNIILSSILLYFVFNFSKSVNRHTARHLFFALIFYLPSLLLLIFFSS